MNLSAALTGLQALLGERLTTAAAVREHHSHDTGWHPASLPDAVAFPRSAEEVQAIVRLCVENDVPMVPFGAGS